MIPLEKPGTPEEIVHFGVKGMKWGVRRSRGTHAFKRDFPTAKERRTEIKRARRSVTKTKSAYKAEPEGPKQQKLKDLHLKNPDRATALRLTRGEKVVAVLLSGPTPIGLVAPAYVGTRVGKRRALED